MEITRDNTFNAGAIIDTNKNYPKEKESFESSTVV
jgi:hypothetical protein